MTEIKYTDKQIEELNSIKYVKNCTSRHIVFTTEFKKLIMKKIAKKHIPARDVFRSFGFPEYVIQSNVPSNSIGRWKYLFEKGIVEEIKGRPRVRF